jgi:hypothetical protein
MHPRLLLLALFIVTGMNIDAQEDKKKTATLPSSFLLLRTNLFSFIEPDGCVTMGAEWRKTEQFSLGLEMSYIFFTSYDFTSRDLPGMSGFRIRPEVRYYFRNNPRKQWFIGLEAQYKQVSYDATQEVCGGGVNCPFVQIVNYKEVKRAPGGAIKIGFQDFLDRNQRLFYEVFLGAGMKSLSYRIKNYVPPPGTTFTPTPGRNSVISNSINSNGISPHIPAGIKIGVRL